MICTVVLYGLHMGVADLGGNVYVNMVLSGILDAPTAHISGMTSDR